MSQIESLPPEILHGILQWVEHEDMATLPHVSHTFRSFIKGNKRLYKYVYLHNLDAPDQGDLDWEKEIHDILKLQAICHMKDAETKKQHLGFVYDTVTRLLKNAQPNGREHDYSNDSNTHLSSDNAHLIKLLFLDQSNVDAFLQRSFLFKRVRNEVHHPIRYNEVPKELHQQSAKLHCLYGRPVLQVGRLRSSKTYPYACSKVYDLRQYTQRSKWGPFMNDGSGNVDWEKVEAIMVVLGHNLRENHLTTKIFQEVWANPFAGSWTQSSLSTIQPSPTCERHKLAHQDPYGVTGTWYRVVCFLDYNAFFSYNFPIGDLIAPDTPRPAIDVGEATRLIVMRIYVSSIEPPGPLDGQELPVVHFKGVSSSLDDSMDDNANSALRGVVRLTREGEVRWTTWSIFHGQERWRSEGVQIGGVKSARGVLGNWFESDYDPHGPVGPTAFWKAADDDRINMFPSALWVPHHSTIGVGDDSDIESWMEDEMDEEVGEVDGEEVDDLLAEADMAVDDVMQTYVDHYVNG